VNDVTLRMPRCEGRPNEACPSRRNDNTVRLSQGDLMLCEECDRFRFPPQPLPSVRSRHNKASEKASASASNIKPTGSAGRVADNTLAPLIRPRKAPILFRQLLGYRQRPEAGDDYIVSIKV